jgi:GT2 family glycosyltransferase
MENKIELSIIIVNYQSADYLKNCVASVFDKIKNISFEIIVVNNSEEEISGISDVQVIHPHENLGFGKGHNLGARNAQGEILWILNADTEILEGDIEKIIREIRVKREIGVIGVKLMGENNKVQLWSAGSELNLWDLIKNNLGIKSSRKIWESKEKREADWVSGTSLFIRKDLFLKMGGFDEKFFMYFEDIDLCKRVRKTEYKVIYFPEFVVKHFGGKSFENSVLQKKYYYQSQDYYFEKHFGKFQSGLVKLLRKLFI